MARCNPNSVDGSSRVHTLANYNFHRAPRAHAQHNKNGRRTEPRQNALTRTGRTTLGLTGSSIVRVRAAHSYVPPVDGKKKKNQTPFAVQPRWPNGNRQHGGADDYPVLFIVLFLISRLLTVGCDSLLCSAFRSCRPKVPPFLCQARSGAGPPSRVSSCLAPRSLRSYLTAKHYSKL